MKSKISLLAILSVATILGLGTTASVLADEHPEDLVCVANAGPFFITNDEFANVTVPPGTNCIMLGNFIVHGNFQSNEGGAVGVNGGTVHGDVQIKGSTSANSGAIDTFIGGSLQLEDNDTLLILRNAIVGDLQCKNNAGLLLIDNKILGNNQCVD